MCITQPKAFASYRCHAHLHPSPERLQAIAAACNAPPQVVQAITSAAAVNDAQMPDTMSALVDTVDALPADAIPPGCAADLIAVAEAIGEVRVQELE